jgi:hypothetical protein
MEMEKENILSGMNWAVARRDLAVGKGKKKASRMVLQFMGTIALVSDGGRAHCITAFIYYEVYVPCETHHDSNCDQFLKPSVCR